MEKTLNLGERILLVARLAVEEHLLQSATAQLNSQSQVTVGGADLDRVKDDSLLLARGVAKQFAAALFAEGEVA